MIKILLYVGKNYNVYKKNYRNLKLKKLFIY